MRAGLPTFVFLIAAAGVVAFLALRMGGNYKGLEKGLADTTTSPAMVTWSGDIRVMTANVRISEPTDGINAWPNRREYLVKTLLKYGPDVIGCQEMTPAQGVYLVKELGKWYDHYPKPGVGKVERLENTSGNLSGAVDELFTSLNTLFYRTDRFEIVDGESGLVIPEQLQADATENTFFTLAVLRKILAVGSPKPADLLIVVDTHIRYKESFALKCVARIRGKIGEMQKKYPEAKVVLMGDMNHPKGSKIYAAIAGGGNATTDVVGTLTDSFDYSKKRPGDAWGNWHAFTGTPQAQWPTDLIFAGTGLTAKRTEIVRDHDSNNRYPSDHFFVMTDLANP